MSRLPLILLCGLLGLGTMPLAEARLEAPVQAKAGRDLAQIRSSRQLRVLVNESRNAWGEVEGEPTGVEYFRLRAFEQYLNARLPDERRLTLKLIPKPKDQLFAALRRGEGDLVAPGERADDDQSDGLIASDDFIAAVPMVAVGRKGGRRLANADQLSGHTVVLPAGSAAGEALDELNARFKQHKRKPVKVEWADPSLAVEDVLEMVQAGIYPLTLVEQTIAERWAKVLPQLRVDRQAHVGAAEGLHWYSRRDTPMLSASIDRFVQTYHAPGNLDATFQRAYRRLYKVHDPLARNTRQRLSQLRPVLQKHGQAQDIDWLNLAALAFKESNLDPAARGSGGATGLMQITPQAAQRVGVGQIRTVDNNVQASARYLSMIRKRFFNSPKLADRERMAFVLAAYNLGPERVQGMRAEARRRGLDPNRWFFQVERVALDQVGMAPVSYVNSVNKYYLAFARDRDALERKRP